MARPGPTGGQYQPLTEDQIQRAMRLSEEKYCSVAATLRGTVEITYDVVIQEDEETQ